MLDFLPDAARTILAFLVVLGVLIFFHELGHYAAARWRRVHVDAFSIGFGRALLRWTDNIRILEELEQAGLMPANDAVLLREVYKAFRSASHRQALQKQAGVVDAGQFADQRREVRRIWSELGLT